MIRRWVFNFVAAVSLLLCTVTAGLWIWSDLRPETWHQIGRVLNINLSVSQGSIVYQGPPQTDVLIIAEGLPVSSGVLTRGATTVLIPCWMISAGSLLLPLIWAVQFKRRIRSLFGCRQCGYDLTGNTSDVCPECGTAIPTKPEAVA